MIDPTRRQFVLSIAALTALQACSGAPSRTDGEIRIGYLRTQGPIVDLSIDPQFAGSGLKLFPFESGNEVLEAVIARAVDIGETGEVQPIFAQSAGQKVKVVGSTAPTQLTSMLVRKDASLRTIADLKGRKVSFVEGTNSHWLLISALHSVGLKQGDIVPVSLNGPDALTSLLNHQVDAIVTTAPATQIAFAQGARELFNNDGLTNSALYYVATDETVRDRPDAVAAFLQALSQHTRWTAANPDKFVAHAVRELGVTPQVATSLWKAVPKGLAPVGTGAIGAYNQRIADAFLAQKLIPARIDAAQGVDGRFDKALRA
jgi:sulfonate transport system substrate-binding protein